MSSEPTEHRHRHADPARPVDVPAGRDAEVRETAAAATPALSRRALRERERRRAAGRADGPGEAASGATGAVSMPGVWPAGATPGVTSGQQPQDEPVEGRLEAGATAVVADSPAGPPERAAARPDRGDVPTVEPTSRMAETVPSDTSGYRLVHYLVLALVACVLGYLIWSLTTGAAEPGASTAGPAVSITSPSAPPTATQGEL